MECVKACVAHCCGSDSFGNMEVHWGICDTSDHFICGLIIFMRFVAKRETCRTVLAVVMSLGHMAVFWWFSSSDCSVPPTLIEALSSPVAGIHHMVVS